MRCYTFMMPYFILANKPRLSFILEMYPCISHKTLIFTKVIMNHKVHYFYKVLKIKRIILQTYMSVACHGRKRPQAMKILSICITLKPLLKYLSLGSSDNSIKLMSSWGCKLQFLCSLLQTWIFLILKY